LLVACALFSGRAEPRHRAYGGILGPQHHDNPRASANRDGQPAAEEELAAIIHLCGAGLAKAFAHRGFHLLPGERCGDHDIAAYLAEIDAMKQKFARLAAEK